jgi:hypothetical protein
MREYGSEFEISYLPDNYFRSIAGMMPYSAFTRSGREAIGLAIEGMKPGVALLPAYCCWSVALPFEAAGWTVAYYPLNKDLTVDVPTFKSLIRDLKPIAVLVMDYYGFAPTHAAVDAAKEINEEVFVMEDFTQCLFGLPEKWNPKEDCYVASIRKSIGVPDGGVVLSRKALDLSLLLEERTPFVEHHIQAGVRKKRYSYSFSSSEKQAFRELQAAAGAEIKEDYHLYKISPEAMGIIENTDTEMVRFARRKNFEHLFDLLKDNQNFDILFAPGNNPAPFMMIIKSTKRDELQSAFARKNVFCQVMWPLADRAKEICPVSKEMEETMLAIPIDQRYSYDDIEEIGQRINSVKL